MLYHTLPPPTVTANTTSHHHRIAPWVRYLTVIATRPAAGTRAKVFTVAEQPADDKAVEGEGVAREPSSAAGPAGKDVGAAARRVRFHICDMDPQPQPNDKQWMQMAKAKFNHA